VGTSPVTTKSVGSASGDEVAAVDGQHDNFGAAAMDGVGGDNPSVSVPTSELTVTPRGRGAVTD
jgi:hypothetical protein